MNKRLGDSNDPLFVSVRSGAAISMPGMMDANKWTYSYIIKEFLVRDLWLDSQSDHKLKLTIKYQKSSAVSANLVCRN